jgi:hypothetical protein
MEGDKMNIEQQCMIAAEKIRDKFIQDRIGKSEAEKAVNEALEVLQLNGLYALFVYLNAKQKDKEYQHVQEGIIKFGNDTLQWGNGSDIFAKIRNISDNMFVLFSAIDAMEQTLMYVRFFAKALEKKVN